MRRIKMLDFFGKAVEFLLFNGSERKRTRVVVRGGAVKTKSGSFHSVQKKILYSSTTLAVAGKGNESGKMSAVEARVMHFVSIFCCAGN